MQIAAWITIAISIVLIGALEFLSKDRSRHMAVLGISFVIGLTILGSFLVQSKQDQKILRVVGYATKPFESDLVKWNVTIQKPAATEGVPDAMNTLYKDVMAFKAFLVEKGVSEKNIDIQPIMSNPVNDNYGNLLSYNVTQNVYVVSTDLKTIEDMSINPVFFSSRGMMLQYSNLGYYYTKLPDLKKALLSEATKDAVARAVEITTAAKSKPGKLKSARAGVFQITEPYSTEVSDYGIYSTSTKNKHISVTLTAEFLLR